ncbi:hypothetical protein GGD65_006395 [Bradyrhizobium sp. CIR18]|nr:hypothetical protein [Bradyrhizobium sp. CIR18]MBB4365329.1 hypothetical protein [Bradyrhizobium sp. CIR18]
MSQDDVWLHRVDECKQSDAGLAADAQWVSALGALGRCGEVTILIGTT